MSPVIDAGLARLIVRQMRSSSAQASSDSQNRSRMTSSHIARPITRWKYSVMSVASLSPTSAQVLLIWSEECSAPSAMEALMSDLFFWARTRRREISPYFPLAHGVPHVDERRVVSGSST